MPNMEPTDEQKLQAMKEAEERKKAKETIKPGRKRPKNYVEQATPKNQLPSLSPFYQDIGPKPYGFGPSKWKWYRNLFRERRKLRKDLKKNHGVKSYREFDRIADEVGLGIDNKFLGFLMGLGGFLFSGGGLATLLSAGVAAMFAFFAWSFIRESVGSFTIQLNPDTMQCDFVLSSTFDFEETTARIDSEQMLHVNAITVSDLPADLDTEAEGPHNGKHYIAYTFYIKNDGEEVRDYEYRLLMKDAILGVDKAIWIMLFEDGHQIIYAQKSADEDSEKIFGYRMGDPPFIDLAYDRDKQYYERDDAWGINTTAWLDEECVAYGVQEGVKPGEIHKYTVVIWLEGNDPECTNDLFDGYAKFRMEFSMLNEERRTLFSGLYRKDYDTYYLEQEKAKHQGTDTENASAE